MQRRWRRLICSRARTCCFEVESCFLIAPERAGWMDGWLNRMSAPFQECSSGSFVSVWVVWRTGGSIPNHRELLTETLASSLRAQESIQMKALGARCRSSAPYSKLRNTRPTGPDTKASAKKTRRVMKKKSLTAKREKTRGTAGQDSKRESHPMHSIKAKQVCEVSGVKRSVNHPCGNWGGERCYETTAVAFYRIVSLPMST